MTKVVNIKKTKDYDVYIGRGSKWGNPYSHIYGKGIYVHSRERAIEKYKLYIMKKVDLLESLPELKGKTLGCFCKPKACHGDILIQLIKELDI